MPPVTIASSALVTVMGHVDTQKVANVLTYKKITGSPTVSDVDALATWWGTTGWGQYKVVLPGAFVLEEIRVRSVDPGLAYQKIITPTGIQTGNVGGDLQNETTTPINWKTATASRRSKGRTSIGPAVEADVTHEAIGTGAINRLLNLAAYLIVTHPTGNWQLAVGSRVGHVAYPIIAAVVEAIIGTVVTRLTRRS